MSYTRSPSGAINQARWQEIVAYLKNKLGWTSQHLQQAGFATVPSITNAEGREQIRAFLSGLP